MTISEINTDITKYTGVGTSEYTPAQRLIDVNQWYHKVGTMILESQDDWDFDDTNYTDYTIATTPFVAAQRDYKLPASLDLIKITRVDITYDGTTYYRASAIDSNALEFGLGNDTNTDSHFTKTSPAYDLRKQSLLVYPLAIASEVSSGAKVRIEFQRLVDEFTSGQVTTGTREPGFDAPFHKMLSIGPSLDFAVAKGLKNKNDLATLLADYEGRLRKFYGRKEADRKYTLLPAYVDYE